MLKWAYNPGLRGNLENIQLDVSEDSSPVISDGNKRSKKKLRRRSMTVGHSAGRRNSFSIVKQLGTSLKAMKSMTSNLSNSALNVSEVEYEIKEEVEEEIETIQEVSKCHFSRVYETVNEGYVTIHIIKMNNNLDGLITMTRLELISYTKTLNLNLELVNEKVTRQT